MTNEHHLTVQRTARYFTMGGNPLGEVSDQTTDLWFCLHGFGQLAQYFSRKFTDVADDKTIVVVPEGLSRLYLNGEYNRVGASWLTREDKEHEIRDFLAYLNQLYDTILAGSSPEKLRITVLGFSQGAATACRWIEDGHIRVDRLFLWAGFFPNGLADVIQPNTLKAVETHYVYGRQDEYIEQMPDPEAYIQRIQADLPSVRITAYEGDHRVDSGVLMQLIR
ncbi:MAG: phospholipase [Cytophagales bacterium]|nr:MAG: phospholipase [Cytophagales bacterium]